MTRMSRWQSLPKNHDIEAYLTTFERPMLAYEVKREKWAYKLAPSLLDSKPTVFCEIQRMIQSSARNSILGIYGVIAASYTNVGFSDYQ